MSTAVYVDPSALQRVASDLRRLGDVPQAKKYYGRLVELGEVNPSYHATGYFELAALEEDIPTKRALLDKALERQPSHVMAGVIRKCLTDEMEARIEQNREVLMPIFSNGFNVQIQTTSRCNATCVMCPYPGSYHDTNPNVMPEDTFEHTLRLLEGFPLRKVCLYLNNEPFLDKNLVEKIRRIKGRLTFDHIEISTNGSGFTDKNIQALCEALEGTRHEIWYSWHGVSKEVYERVMGLNWDQNVRRLQAYLRITQGRLKTIFRTITGGRLHIDEQYSTRDEAERFFREQITAAGLDVSNRNLVISPFTFHDRAGSVTFYGKRAPHVAAMVGSLKPECWRLYEWLHIVDDATVILCCMDFNKETVTVDIRDYDRLEDLLNAPPIALLRNQALGRVESPPNFICKRCTSPGG